MKTKQINLNIQTENARGQRVEYEIPVITIRLPATASDITAAIAEQVFDIAHKIAEQKGGLAAVKSTLDWKKTPSTEADNADIPF